MIAHYTEIIFIAKFLFYLYPLKTIGSPISWKMDGCGYIQMSSTEIANQCLEERSECQCALRDTLKKAAFNGQKFCPPHSLWVSSLLSNFLISRTIFLPPHIKAWSVLSSLSVLPPQSVYFFPRFYLKQIEV